MQITWWNETKTAEVESVTWDIMFCREDAFLKVPSLWSLCVDFFFIQEKSISILQRTCSREDVFPTWRNQVLFGRNACCCYWFEFGAEQVCIFSMFTFLEDEDEQKGGRRVLVAWLSAIATSAADRLSISPRCQIGTNQTTSNQQQEPHRLSTTNNIRQTIEFPSESKPKEGAHRAA